MKKRLIALLLSLVMLLTCMGAALETVVDTADTAADAAAQTDTAAPAEPTGEDTTDAEPNDEETDASVDPVEDPDAEPSAEPEQPTDAAEEETPAEEAPVENDDAVVDGEETDAKPVEDEEDADTDEDADAEPVYPLVSFTNVAPFLDPVTGSGSSSFVDKVKDFVSGIGDTISGWFAPSTADDTSASVKTTSGGTEEKDGMVYSKTATKNADGSYTIKIETYATGEVTSKETEKPTDIILVLDLSNSMETKDMLSACTGMTNSELYAIYNSSKGQHSGGGGQNKNNGLYYKVDKAYQKVSVKKSSSTYTYSYNNNNNTISTSTGDNTVPDNVTFYQYVTRLAALQEACRKFADSVAQKSTTEIDHRIAVVGFNKNGYIFIGNNYKNTVAANAFQNMNDNDGKNNVKASINALGNAQASNTLPSEGMKNAIDIFNADSKKNATDRTRVVVMFTDGFPGTGQNTFDTAEADRAIDDANTLRNKYSATVYSIAVYDGADPLQAGSKTGSNTDKINWFLHHVSNNGNNTPKVDEKSYYLTAGDGDALNTIFNKISQNIGSTSVTLGESSVVRDVVTKYFEMPSNKSDISVMTYDCTGKDATTGEFEFKTDGEKLTDAVAIDEKTNIINVSGFDFAGNYCRETPVTGQEDFYGKKLVISFTVTPKPGFIGGNDVPTNEGTSGIYETSTSEKATFTFPVPTVNVPINAPDLTGQDANVYYLGNVPTADKLCTNYDTSSDMYKFVTVDYSLGSQTVSNTADGEYTVTATIKPTSNGANSAGKPNDMTGETKTATSNVYVYVPELTFQDSEIDLGDTADYDNNKPTGYEKWVHVNNEDKSKTYSTNTGVTMYEANAPTLTLSYSQEAKAFTEDTPVKVTVKIGNVNVTSKVQFKHNETCKHDGCTFDTVEKTQGYHFIVHLKTFDLTITKSITNNEGTLYGARDFVFNVKGKNDSNKNIDINVVVHVGSNGTGSTVVKGLPIGTYTVTEDTTWSWRYDLTGVVAPSGSTGTVSYTSGNSATYNPSGANNEIEFTNNLVRYKWLSFTASVRNFFAGTAGSK